MNSPVFFMRDEEIVDVFYGDFKPGGRPVLPGGTIFGKTSFGPASGYANKVIIEAPDGCWEWSGILPKGNYFTLTLSLNLGEPDNPSDSPLQRCQRLNPDAVKVEHEALA